MSRKKQRYLLDSEDRMTWRLASLEQKYHIRSRRAYFILKYAQSTR